MTENEKGVFGCMGWLVVIVLGGATIHYVGLGIEMMRDPQAYRERQLAAIADAEANERAVADKAAADLAADEARRAEKVRYEAEQREKENSCIRELDYDTCRRIYQPTREELEAQLAISQRANRIAEAYQGQ